VSKAIDKAAGAEREKVPASGGLHKNANLNDDGWSKIGSDASMMDGNIPATEAAKQWQGWGTALKPALEPITVARKPLIGTVAANVLEWGTGALNVDGCWVGTESTRRDNCQQMFSKDGVRDDTGRPALNRSDTGSDAGRWPANLIHDGSEPADLLGEAARFFYCAKASKRDRDEGLEGFATAAKGSLNMRSDAHAERNGKTPAPRANVHPTVKPTDLMRYLCRLVTPPGGVVLDPFTGSGSTGKAAVLEGFRFIGIEREAEYLDIACKRIELAAAQGSLLDFSDAKALPAVQESLL
jgi:site-specific DNA-methyltransferase (adenine-specific)